MSDWYVIKCQPGSQAPQREYKVEPTAVNNNGRVRGKGYRIVPSLNPNMSAVEQALKRNGFSFYMPAEKRLIRDRRHTDLWKVRRFALMVGYVFVYRPHDFRLLEETAGVSHIIKSTDGSPLAVSWDDIHTMRAIEADSEVDFDAKSRSARQRVRRKSKDDPRLKKLVAKLDITGNLSVPLNYDFEAA